MAARAAVAGSWLLLAAPAEYERYFGEGGAEGTVDRRAVVHYPNAPHGEFLRTIFVPSIGAQARW